MRAIVHIGSHKSATTTFQHINLVNRERLQAAGIFYFSPAAWGPSHNILSIELQNQSTTTLEKVIRECGNRLGENGVLLISSENLEGSIYGQLDLRPFHDVLEKNCESIDYIFVERKPFDYFESLYCEKAKWKIAYEYEEMAREICNYGHINIDNPDHKWGFCFNASKHLNVFKSQYSSLRIIPFQEYLAGYPGKIIHKLALDLTCTGQNMTEELSDYYLNNPDKQILNARDPDFNVELSYSAAFLGIKQETFDKSPEVKGICLMLAAYRLRLRQQKRERIKNMFEASFATNSTFK